ncbi:MAG TPA: helix-turn-helix transcriptional regulator [Aggregatilineales bacterium]|nr:helix-turn-helix transcriptional regulator [Aggregatilineales bacterium]
MIVGSRLKALREAKNLNTEELAKVIGTVRQQISRYENEQTDVTSESLVKLADFFGVSTDYLLGRTDSENDVPEPPSGKRSILKWTFNVAELLNAFGPERVARTIKATGMPMAITPEVLDVKELLNEYPPKLVATFLHELGHEMKIKSYDDK